MSRIEIRLLAASALGAAWIACSAGRPEPVEIVLNEDTCSQCRMAVSERPFAAELITESGLVHAYDDIGCLGKWLQTNDSQDIAGMFVIDYLTGEWLDAAEASYVLSGDLPTPMGYGIAALRSPEQARKEADKLGGEVLSWHQVLEEVTK